MEISNAIYTEMIIEAMEILYDQLWFSLLHTTIIIIMAHLNANYLSPNSLSTKISQAPGGPSSFSLAWDPPPTNHGKKTNKKKSEPATLMNP